MTLSAHLLRRFTGSVELAKFTGFSARGAASYSSTPTTHPARVELRSIALKDSQGREVLARGRVFLAPSSTGGLPNPTVQDRLTLSTAFAPERTPPILLVNISTGPTIGRAVEVIFG